MAAARTTGSGAGVRFGGERGAGDLVLPQLVLLQLRGQPGGHLAGDGRLALPGPLGDRGHAGEEGAVLAHQPVEGLAELGGAAGDQPVQPLRRLLALEVAGQHRLQLLHRPQQRRPLLRPLQPGEDALDVGVLLLVRLGGGGEAVGVLELRRLGRVVEGLGGGLARRD